MIGKNVTIRGELSGDNDVVIDGCFEGKVSLTKNFAVGKNGKVDADVSAQGVNIAGQFKGSLTASQRVEIDASATVVGNIAAPRLSISDGAFYKGTVEMTESTSGPSSHEPPVIEE